MANKRKVTAEDITDEETTQNHPDWTPLILEDGDSHSPRKAKII